MRSHAGTSGAGIPNGARIGIVAFTGISGVQATHQRIAAIVGAGIAIVTVEGGPAGTLTVFTHVVYCTEVIVATGGPVEFVEATDLRAAAVIGARVAVVTRFDARWDAEAGLTLITGCADVAVVTSAVQRTMFTAFSGTTRIRGAGIAIITLQGRSGETDSGATNIRVGAGVTVTTGACNWCVLATGPRLARICRTGVLIAAIERSSPQAFTSNASRPVGAGIFVVTGKSFV